MDGFTFSVTSLVEDILRRALAWFVWCKSGDAARLVATPQAWRSLQNIRPAHWRRN